MTEYLPLPPLENLKQQAKRLRVQTNANGPPISHSQSLELLADQYGYKNWNTLHAAAGNQPMTPLVQIGSRVKGQYLGHDFEGDVIAVASLSHATRFRVTINFDKPVDVVAFEGMTNMRKRVTSEIGLHGASVEKTSNGKPLMQLQF